MSTAQLQADVQQFSDAYCVFGLATCFVREEGSVESVEIIEPIPSAAIETIFKGIETSYQWARAMTLGQFMDGDRLKIPGEFPADAHLCEDFLERAIASARTYQKAPHVQDLLPLNTQKGEFNYSTDRKRLLNAENIVSTEDNVKQHSYTHQVL